MHYIYYRKILLFQWSSKIQTRYRKGLSLVTYCILPTKINHLFNERKQKLCCTLFLQQSILRWNFVCKWTWHVEHILSDLIHLKEILFLLYITNTPFLSSKTIKFFNKRFSSFLDALLLFLPLCTPCRWLACIIGCYFLDLDA